jgi:medium-chain acyl-[acyl-carrier-protein] hydrolase
MLIQALRLMGGLPDAVLRDPDVLHMFLPTARADLKAFESWSPAAEGPLNVPITALGGLTDLHPTADRIDEWRPETCAGFRSFTFPGGHFYLNPSQAPLLEVIRRTLDGGARRSLADASPSSASMQI